MAETLDTHCYKDLLRATHEQAKNIAVIAFIIETNGVCAVWLSIPTMVTKAREINIPVVNDCVQLLQFSYCSAADVIQVYMIVLVGRVSTIKCLWKEIGKNAATWSITKCLISVFKGTPRSSSLTSRKFKGTHTLNVFDGSEFIPRNMHWIASHGRWNLFIWLPVILMVSMISDA